MATATWGSGNVRDARLVDIWERAAAMRYNRGRTTETLWGYCKGCYYAEVCLGGCTWTGEAILGKPGWIDGQRHLDAHVHYMKGTGAPMKVDLNALGFDNVPATAFPAVADALKAHKGASGPVTVTLPASHAVVTPDGADAVWAGRVVADLAAGSKLTIQPNGSYSLDGSITVRPELYDFDPNSGRKSPFAEASTWIGLIGSNTPFNEPRPYTMNFVGSKNFDRNVVLTTGLNSGRLHGR